MDYGGGALVERNSVWSTPVVIDGGSPLVAVSCSTATSCVAAEAGGNVLSWNGASWSAPTYVTDGIVDIACPTKSFCALVDQEGDVFTDHNSTWKQGNYTDLGQAVAISCPSRTFCMAVDGSGNYTRYDGRTWTGATASGGGNGYEVVGLGCASSTFCVLDDTTGAIYRWSGVAAGWAMAGQPAWTGGTVACADGATSCVALSGTDALTVSGSSITDPTTIDPYAGGPIALSCASATSCTLIDQSYTAQQYDGTGWGSNTALPTVNGFEYPVSSVSCPTATFCAAVADYPVEGEGTFLEWNGSTWAIQQAPRGLTSVSCTSATFCVAVAPSGFAERWNGKKWKEISLHYPGNTAGYWSSVSCVAATCVTVSNNGYAATYTHGTFSDPALYDDVTSTNPVGGDPAPPVPTVSCPQALACVAVDGFGNAQDLSDGTWTTPQSIDTVGLTGLSCPTTTFCQAVDGSGNVVTRQGTTWDTSTPLSPDHPDLNVISCASAEFCEATTSDGWTVRYGS